MLTIACVLRSGGIYTPEWVAKLQAQCHRWAPPHKFVCLSDVDVPCERIALEHDWPGWWAKIEVFRLPGPVLFFDLDTLIIGDLHDIAARTLPPSGFTILRDFYRPNGYGSAVMAWDMGIAEADVHWWYRRFASDPAAWIERLKSRGDQGFIEENEHRVTQCWQDVVPNQIRSFKADHCREAPPADTRVVCFHGPPKPSNCGGWAQAAWETAA